MEKCKGIDGPLIVQNAIEDNIKLTRITRHLKCIIQEKAETIDKLRQELLDAKVNIRLDETAVANDMKERTISSLNTRIQQLECQISDLTEELAKRSQRTKEATESMNKSNELVLIHWSNADERRSEVTKLLAQCQELRALNTKITLDMTTLQWRLDTDNKTYATDRQQWKDKEYQLQEALNAANNELTIFKHKKEMLQDANLKAALKIEELSQLVSDAQLSLNVLKYDFSGQTGSSCLNLIDRKVQACPEVTWKLTQTSQPLQLNRESQTFFRLPSTAIQTENLPKTSVGCQSQCTPYVSDVASASSHNKTHETNLLTRTTVNNQLWNRTSVEVKESKQSQSNVGSASSHNKTHETNLTTRTTVNNQLWDRTSVEVKDSKQSQSNVGSTKLSSISPLFSTDSISSSMLNSKSLFKPHSGDNNSELRDTGCSLLKHRGPDKATSTKPLKKTVFVKHGERSDKKKQQVVDPRSNFPNEYLMVKEVFTKTTFGPKRQRLSCCHGREEVKSVPSSDQSTTATTVLTNQFQSDSIQPVKKQTQMKGIIKGSKEGSVSCQDSIKKSVKFPQQIETLCQGLTPQSQTETTLTNNSSGETKEFLSARMSTQVTFTSTDTVQSPLLFTASDLQEQHSSPDLVKDDRNDWTSEMTPKGIVYHQ